ncbi:probable ATP-dependent helicase PF08_0048 [Daphnia magna]|uniref:probable ATP-dependent helicase PF08_0048 n=1 Tax=Daphnia magna TaxID=35525 RepID=UPI001E1BD89B|nr:probable ATP-dependent helicase PF08_0048 [Daphnia magna]
MSQSRITGSKYTRKLYFDPRADEPIADGYWMTDDELCEKLSILIDTDEKIQNTSIYINPLYSWQFINFNLCHAFVIIQTLNWWWSIEKNTECITIQRSRDIESVRDMDQRKKRTTGLTPCAWIRPIKTTQGNNVTIKELINYFWRKDVLNKDYHFLTANCQEFALMIFARIESYDHQVYFDEAADQHDNDNDADQHDNDNDADQHDNDNDNDADQHDNYNDNDADQHDNDNDNDADQHDNYNDNDADQHDNDNDNDADQHDNDNDNDADQHDNYNDNDADQHDNDNDNDADQHDNDNDADQHDNDNDADQHDNDNDNDADQHDNYNDNDADQHDNDNDNDADQHDNYNDNDADQHDNDNDNDADQHDNDNDNDADQHDNYNDNDADQHDNDNDNDADQHDNDNDADSTSGFYMTVDKALDEIRRCGGSEPFTEHLECYNLRIPFKQYLCYPDVQFNILFWFFLLLIIIGFNIKKIESFSEAIKGLFLFCSMILSLLLLTIIFSIDWRDGSKNYIVMIFETQEGFYWSLEQLGRRLVIHRAKNKDVLLNECQRHPRCTSLKDEDSEIVVGDLEWKDMNEVMEYLCKKFKNKYGEFAVVVGINDISSLYKKRKRKLRRETVDV